MPQLSTSKHFQPLQKLPFCYLCGAAFLPGDKCNRDHVPPRAVILDEHRSPALWLPTHSHCNSKESQRDERIGQLIDLLHGKRPRDARHVKLEIDHQRGSVLNLDIDPIIVRWVRGLHSALYEEPLLFPFRMILTTPFVKADAITGVISEMRPEHKVAVSLIKENRAANHLDSVRSSGGKFLYECVWGRDADGAWACAFAINLYEWKELGRSHHGPARGCGGFYYLPDLSLPPAATKGTIMLIPVSNMDTLDPFGR